MIKSAEGGNAMPDDPEQPQADLPPEPKVSAPTDVSWLEMDLIELSRNNPDQERRRRE